MDAGFEVAISRKDTGGHEIVVRDRFFQSWMKRAGIADAGRATVADGLKAEFVQVRLKTCLFEVIGDDARAGRERRLDGRIDLQASLDRLLGEQRRAEHDARIAGIGATRDGGDENTAVSDFRVGLVVGGSRRGGFVRRRTILDQLGLVFRQALFGVVGVGVSGRHLGVCGGSRAIDVHRHSEQDAAGLFAITAFGQRLFKEGLKGLASTLGD